MIFVTVGTHEQQFNRLIKEVDELIRDGEINDAVFMQIGYSTYEPKYCEWAKVISYDEIAKYEDEANVIITHGGPASFMSVLSKGKTPIVVPRLEKFGEHVNDHQMDFALKVKEKGYNILLIEKKDIMKDAIDHARNRKSVIFSNTKFFNDEFLMVISGLKKVQ